LQGYLLKNKTRPRECVEEVAAWIVKERETREKLKKEKAEVWHLPPNNGRFSHLVQKEAKEKAEAEEKAKKEVCGVPAIHAKLLTSSPEGRKGGQRGHGSHCLIR